jgi:flagellum-specific peptidoglycan hydrolase FlgJ
MLSYTLNLTGGHMEKQAYFDLVVSHAQDMQAKYGVYTSVCISMSCVESSWGESHEATVDKNILGIKTPGNHNPSLNISQGDYATDDGGYYCHYDSWADCIDDYGYFLRNWLFDYIVYRLGDSPCYYSPDL